MMDGGWRRAGGGCDCTKKGAHRCVRRFATFAVRLYFVRNDVKQYNEPYLSITSLFEKPLLLSLTIRHGISRKIWPKTTPPPPPYPGMGRYASVHACALCVCAFSTWPVPLRTVWRETAASESLSGNNALDSLAEILL